MDFKVKFIPRAPATFVLKEETKLSGIGFGEVISPLIRRIMNDDVQTVHNILGNRTSYSVDITSGIANDSGKFKDTTEYTVVVDEDWFAQFIFHSGKYETVQATNAYSYPFACRRDIATITNHIDEMAVIQAWADSGYVLDMSTPPVEPPVDGGGEVTP